MINKKYLKKQYIHQRLCDFQETSGLVHHHTILIENMMSPVRILYIIFHDLPMPLRDARSTLAQIPVTNITRLNGILESFFVYARSIVEKPSE